MCRHTIYRCATILVCCAHPIFYGVYTCAWKCIHLFDSTSWVPALVAIMLAPKVSCTPASELTYSDLTIDIILLLCIIVRI